VARSAVAGGVCRVARTVSLRARASPIRRVGFSFSFSLTHSFFLFLLVARSVLTWCCPGDARVCPQSYTKDLVMNSEWYDKKKTYHTHPAFCGEMKDVILVGAHRPSVCVEGCYCRDGACDSRHSQRHHRHHTHHTHTTQHTHHTHHTTYTKHVRASHHTQPRAPSFIASSHCAVCVHALLMCVQDCCGSCPPIPADVDPATLEQFVSGPLKWVTDNPGQQRIGSFHPITSGDWTDGAYLSEATLRVCCARACRHFQPSHPTPSPTHSTNPAVSHSCTHECALSVSSLSHTSHPPLSLLLLVLLTMLSCLSVHVCAPAAVSAGEPRRDRRHADAAVVVDACSGHQLPRHAGANRAAHRSARRPSRRSPLPHRRWRSHHVATDGRPHTAAHRSQ
jgi:hypothetical protein